MVDDSDEGGYPQAKHADWTELDEDMELAQARLVYHSCGNERPATDAEYQNALQEDSRCFASWLAARKNFNNLRKARGCLPIVRAKSGFQKKRKSFRRGKKGRKPKGKRDSGKSGKSRTPRGDRRSRSRTKPGPPSSSHKGDKRPRDRSASKSSGRAPSKGRKSFRRPKAKIAEPDDETSDDTSHSQAGFGAVSEPYIQDTYTGASHRSFSHYFNASKRSGWNMVGGSGTSGDFMCA